MHIYNYNKLYIDLYIHLLFISSTHMLALVVQEIVCLPSV